jgi:hypothetical protein
MKTFTIYKMGLVFNKWGVKMSPVKRGSAKKPGLLTWRNK